VLLLAITIGAVGWWLGVGRWTEVPSLAGTEENAAIDQLQDAGLDPDPVVPEWSETVPEGQVIATDPTQGELIRGTDVRVVVSKGPERYVVAPELEGRPVDEVEAEIQENLPVQVARGEDYDDDLAAGLVIRFDPPAGTQLKRDQVVTIVISAGRAPVAIPDVTGQTPEQATRNLEALGFRVERVQDGRSDKVDTGEVMAVSPAPGGPVPFGSTVKIQVSSGPPLVTVPDVVGKSGDEATAILQAAGLEVESTRFFGNSVLRQSPAAGESVERGTSVTILLTFG
jgi:serine/threonine-protein kinase